ncbi:hypothetical protein BLOT_005100 [Blomia tropicalis]|nr:hypothetical protein BLOT_005100 [Blomia tropicalis]
MYNPNVPIVSRQLEHNNHLVITLNIFTDKGSCLNIDGVNKNNDFKMRLKPIIIDSKQQQSGT